MFVRSDDGALVDAASSEGQAIASRAAMRAELARAASERTKTLDTGDTPGNDTAPAAPADGSQRAPEATPMADTGPLVSPAVELPAQLWRMRVAWIGSTFHFVSSTAPVEHKDESGRLVSCDWTPVDCPGSDTIAHIDWTTVCGLSWRIETQAKKIRELYRLPALLPEDDPAAVTYPCAHCTTPNVARRRACRRCGASLSTVKPRVRRKRKPRAKSDVPDAGMTDAMHAAKAKPKAKAKRRSRARPPDLKTCLACGATVERVGPVKKMGRCPECNSLEGWS